MKNYTGLTAQSQKANQPSYMIQLDALRALAVFGVMFTHFMPEGFFLNSFVEPGELGVQLFFVLSGYLITGILLRCRDMVDLGKQDAGFTIKRFYIRRFIRLMPIYYLAIATTAIINIEGVREGLFWYLTYTSNIHTSIVGHWDGSSHFWSLAVEEQFYLFWPWFILLLPKKHLLKFMLLAFTIGPLSRFLCISVGLNQYWRYTLPFTNLDPLAMGALLAYSNYSQGIIKHHKTYLFHFGFWIGISLVLIFKIIDFLHPNNVFYPVLFQTILCFCFLWLVARAAQGFGGVTGTILELKPLTYIGKISYGIYVYHYFMPYIIPRIFNHIGLPYPKNILLSFVLLTIISLTVAILSWHLIEKPINNLKQHFRYIKKTV